MKVTLRLDRHYKLTDEKIYSLINSSGDKIGEVYCLQEDTTHKVQLYYKNRVVCSTVHSNELKVIKNLARKQGLIIDG